jgi:hypothetical protein
MISTVWTAILEAPAVAIKAENALRILCCKMNDLSRMNGSFDLLQDPLGLALACAEYAQSIKLLKSVGATAASLAVESLGLDVAEEEEEESEKEDGPDVGFVIPSEAVVKKIKDQMRKTKDVREKMKIFFDAPSLRELYDENPTIPVKAFSDSYRVFVGNTLRPAFACYVGCCEGKLDKMMEAYEGKKFNLSNFSVGCVHKGTWILPAWQLNTSE